MAHILHISDLHLSENPTKDLIGDSKQAAVPPEMQQTSSGRLISTFEALARALDETGEVLDCIVISGDIADRNGATAYARLPAVLAPLVPGLVPANRVVVVPGNHDVAQRSAPSSTDRWANFMQVKEYGYLLPLLEGVDIDDKGAPLRSPTTPVLVARDGSFVLVALNSANHCQSSLPVEASLNPHMDELESLSIQHPAIAELLKSWQARGLVDVAWIGDGQQRAAAAALSMASRDAPNAARIAVIHHQLFPVGSVAEIKSFETMANLGEFLDWLADSRIDVVLHGHKHTQRDFAFEHSPFHAADATPGYRTLVMSAPSAQTGQQSNAPIARLLTIEAPEPRVGGVVVRDIPSIQSGGQVDVERIPSQRVRLDPDIRRGQILGDTFDEVHDKLLALQGDYSDVGHPMICRVRQGETAARIPTNYPDIPHGISDPQAWFEQTVTWWQKRRAGKAATFNHGQRLQDFVGRGASTNASLNQIQLAAEALSRKQGSSRAIAILVDPHADLALPDREFPAFVLVQFAIESDRLNVTGYFRKQEMPHWWPINLSELGRLQMELIALYSGGIALRAGAITTITSQPVSGDAVPRVAIPSLDGRVDAPNGMLELVLPLFSPTAATVEETLQAWRLTFDDWAPSLSAPADGDPVPLVGLTDLGSALREMSLLLNRLRSAN